MAQVIKYASVSGSLWSVDLQTVRRDSISWTHRAENGEVGTSEFVLEDPDGTGGHESDALLGHKTIRVYENTAHPSNSNILTGFVGERRYLRNAEAGLLTGAARDIQTTVVDINAAASFEIFHDGDGNRPVETVSARITWLLGSGYLQAFNNGLVETPTVSMDANNYDGQTPADVLGDCALKASFNWWLYWDPALFQTSLGFLDANTSTLYSSDLRISNVEADVDSGIDEGVGPTTTYFPFLDAALTRSPQHTYSGIYLTWDGGATYRRRGATGSNFAWRDGAAPTASVKSSASAITLADAELDQAATEADGLTVTIVVLATEVNEVRAGQRLEVKFSHLPGYEDWRWCRVLTKTVRQELRSDVYYIDLTLSPQCPALGQDWFGALTQQGSPNLTKYSLPQATTDGKTLLVFYAVRATTNAATVGSNGYTLIAELENANGEDGNAIGVWAKDADGTETYFEGAVDAGVQGYAAQLSGTSVADLVSATAAVEGGSEFIDVNLTTTARAITYLFVTLDLARLGGGAAVDWTTDLDTVEVANQNDIDPILFIARETETTGGTYNLQVGIPDNVAGDFTTYPPQFQAIAIGCVGSGSCG